MRDQLGCTYLHSHSKTSPWDPQKFPYLNPLDFLPFWAIFYGWQNFTANHSSASVKCENHDEMQFELSWTQLFEGQPIELSIFPPGAENFSLWTLFWKHHDRPTWMHLPRFRF